MPDFVSHAGPKHETKSGNMVFAHMSVLQQLSPVKESAVLMQGIMHFGWPVPPGTSSG